MAVHSNAYAFLILVLTVISLVIMVPLLLPIDPALQGVLTFWDNVICVVFLVDFGWNLWRSHPRRAYLVDGGGWLDLLGSIPSLGFLRFSGLLRLFRLSRLFRIRRLFSGQDKTDLIADALRHRQRYAAVITALLVFLVLLVASVLVVLFESQSPQANIRSGENAAIWSLVTLGNTGYGNLFPVTTLGRSLGIVVMFAGIALVGALASMFTSFLLSSGGDDQKDSAGKAGAGVVDVGAGAVEPPPAAPTAAEPTSVDATATELALIRQELAAIRRMLAESAKAGSAGQTE
jgi:voltage-gated potassium channel